MILTTAELLDDPTVTTKKLLETFNVERKYHQLTDNLPKLAKPSFESFARLNGIKDS